jgi:hypothetical protein
MFDSDDDMLFDLDENKQIKSETNSEPHSSFDDDPLIDDDAVFGDTDDFQDDESAAKDNPYYEQLLKDARFTLGYAFSNNLRVKPSFVTHETYLRSEIQTLLSENLFFQFDGRLNYFFDTAHWHCILRQSQNPQHPFQSHRYQADPNRLFEMTTDF